MKLVCDKYRGWAGGLGQLSLVGRVMDVMTREPPGLVQAVQNGYRVVILRSLRRPDECQRTASHTRHLWRRL